MEVVKRLEIIALEHEMPHICKALDQVGVADYTIIRNVTGKSQRSTGDDDLTFAGLGHVYIICCCQKELLNAVVAAITPLLNKFGGVCYISDAVALGIVNTWSSESNPQ